MLLSMTGYGRAEAREAGRSLAVEIRSINHRFAEISIRLPKSLASLENRVREAVQARLSRGKITLSVTLDGEENELGTLRVDETAARRYVSLLRELKDKIGVSGDVDLTTLIGLPDVITWEKNDYEEEAGWRLLEAPLNGAIADLIRMKSREGEMLSKDMLARIDTILATLARIEARIPLVLQGVRERLQERLAELLSDSETEYQKLRLEAEVVLFADRTDSTEECVRLRAHCQQFRDLIRAPEPAGRKLTFLLQEMNREANTIGSKNADIEIARSVIIIKEETERLREQVANIE
ncbi:MAG: YicC/YloC family endoribonuclease [Candidatus Eisenbacteria bacterium]|nr:YicC/YloC family endoribonuclease [Candidatus Eisenbacteria bacterium]